MIESLPGRPLKRSEYKRVREEHDEYFEDVSDPSIPDGLVCSLLISTGDEDQMVEYSPRDETWYHVATISPDESILEYYPLVEEFYVTHYAGNTDSLIPGGVDE
jgi:hypothetical protein